MNFTELGYCDWYQSNLGNLDEIKNDLARIIAINKNNYIIRNEECEYTAKIPYKMKFDAISNLELPAVGDWIKVNTNKKNSTPVIEKIYPRKSVLKRKVAGKRIEYQLIASNIDYTFLVQSLDINFNINRLERYLTMVNDSNIQPIILLSKLDLITPEELEEKIAIIKNAHIENDVYAFSNKTGEGLDTIKQIITPGLTYCLLGSSGVGKTTLLNSIIGEEIYGTMEVREKDSKGKHKTTRRELVVLDSGGLIIDTPGMRELGNIDIKTGIDETFTDIDALGKTCKFRNCSHTSEPGCSVLKAVKNKELKSNRYENYIKLSKETEFYEQSYIEKRRSEKNMGKMFKRMHNEIKEQNKKRRT